MPRIDHVLVTRFNLPTQGVEGLIRAREGWLQDRVALFERYCAPSVARQTRPVSWVVYLDPESPPWLLDRLRPYTEAGLFHTVLRASVTRHELLSDIRHLVPDPGDILITTNLDNDDGLALDFSERVMAVETPHPRVVVYLTRGLIKKGEQVYSRRDRRNAFCSIREPWDGAVTAWSEYHNEFPRVMPVVQLGGPPGWLQVVHGSNVSNRIRGRRINPTSYASRFEGLLDDADIPTTSEVARDLIVALPVRFARDLGRSAMRSSGLRLLGKDRYQAAKLQLSKISGRNR